MSDIFISYSSQDRGRIQPIVQALESKGWSVWWDREIPIGRTFDEVIEEAIDEAKCVVVIWTEASVSSKWVRTEAGEGEERGILIPVLFDDVKVPLAFRRIEMAQLVNWDGVSDHPEMDVLMNSITGLIGQPEDIKQDQFIFEEDRVEQRAPKKTTDERQEIKSAEFKPIPCVVDRETERKPWRPALIWGWIVGGIVIIGILIGVLAGVFPKLTKIEESFTGHTDWVSSVAFSPDG